MSPLVHYEFPVPRSWEQFEELCADVFEAMWRDPGLVRNGRAGQRQHGVDIVAARGGVSPVGLQCKKKTQWPVKRLTFAEVKKETEEAEKFTPSLKEFYILTTAQADQHLDEKVRVFNLARAKAGLFAVTVLPWPEILRRVARYADVASKHFPQGDRHAFSPLLATWYAKGGKLELSGKDWDLAVLELGEDFQDWPSGHVAVRARETDALVASLKDMRVTAVKGREQKLELRRQLRFALAKEGTATQTIRMLYTNRLFKSYMLDVYDKDAPAILQSIIEFATTRELGRMGDSKIRLSPPSVGRLAGPFSPNSIARDDVPVDMSGAEFASILAKEREFPKRYNGRRMDQCVMELPAEVQSRRAIPAILRYMNRVMEEDKKTLEELELAGFLHFPSWRYKH